METSCVFFAVQTEYLNIFLDQHEISRWDFRCSRRRVSLMMEAVSSCETSANIYRTTRRNILEDCHLHISKYFNSRNKKENASSSLQHCYELSLFSSTKQLNNYLADWFVQFPSIREFWIDHCVTRVAVIKNLFKSGDKIGCQLCSRVWNWETLFVRLQSPYDLSESTKNKQNENDTAYTYASQTRNLEGLRKPRKISVKIRSKIKLAILGNFFDDATRTCAAVKNAWSYASTSPYVCMAWCLV
jgi:hypothetical protein